ncbi:hypothetical protein Tco_0044659 [Tanacetum coccineum]
MNRGQPDNEIKDFDDLYNNLKVYEHELKGVSNSSSPNIAFMSTEVKGSTLKQSTAEPTNIPKGYTQVLPQARVRFASSQKTMQNGRAGKEDCGYWKIQNSKALGQQTYNEDIDWTKTFAFRQDGLGEFGLGAIKEDNTKKQKELDQALKERDDFKVKLEKWSNAAVLQNEVLNKQRYVSDKSCIGFGVESSSDMESDNSSGNTNSNESLYSNFQKEKGFHSVPPPTGTIIPPRANVSFTGIDELAIRNKIVSQEKTQSSQPEIDRNKVIIEDWETLGTLTKGGLLSHQQYLQGKGTARSRVPQAVLSRSTGRPYYPRMDNRRPRISSYSPSSRSSTTRTPNRPHRPKKIVKSIWGLRKEVLLDHKQYFHKMDNGSYTLKQFEYGKSEEDLKELCYKLKVLLWKYDQENKYKQSIYSRNTKAN